MVPCFGTPCSIYFLIVLRAAVDMTSFYIIDLKAGSPKNEPKYFSAILVFYRHCVYEFNLAENKKLFFRVV